MSINLAKNISVETNPYKTVRVEVLKPNDKNYEKVPVTTIKKRYTPSDIIKKYYIKNCNSVQRELKVPDNTNNIRNIVPLKYITPYYGGVLDKTQAQSTPRKTIEEIAVTLTEEYKEHISEAISTTVSIFGDLIGENGRIEGRKKNADSILPKLIAKKVDDNPIEDNEEFTEFCRSKIKDAYGTRIELETLNKKQAQDIIEENGMDYDTFTQNIQKYIKNNEVPPQEYIAIIDELKAAQTEAIVQRIIQQKDNPNFKITEIENYGDELASYLTYDQVKRISEALEIPMVTVDRPQNRINTEIKLSDENEQLSKEHPAIKPSGYTTCQMNITYSFKDKTKGYGELQVRGRKLNQFADSEHVLYDIRKGKTKEGTNNHADIYNLLNGMSKKSTKDYYKYLTSVYKAIRLQELGLDIKIPKLEGTFTYKNGTEIPSDTMNKISYSNIIKL